MYIVSASVGTQTDNPAEKCHTSTSTKDLCHSTSGVDVAIQTINDVPAGKYTMANWVTIVVHTHESLLPTQNILQQQVVEPMLTRTTKLLLNLRRAASGMKVTIPLLNYAIPAAARMKGRTPGSMLWMRSSRVLLASLSQCLSRGVFHILRQAGKGSID